MVFAGAPARAGQLVAEYPYPNPRASAALTLGRSPRFASAMAASSEPMIATAASLATRAPDGIRTDISPPPKHRRRCNCRHRIRPLAAGARRSSKKQRSLVERRGERAPPAGRATRSSTRSSRSRSDPRPVLHIACGARPRSTVPTTRPRLTITETDELAAALDAAAARRPEVHSRRRLLLRLVEERRKVIARDRDDETARRRAAH